MKNNLLKICLVIYFTSFDVAMFCQGGPGSTGDGTGGVEGDDPPAAPISSKLIILMIIGITYAYYRIKNLKKAI